MQYVRVKHKKIGDERIFTQPVFDANQHHYKFIEYTDNPNGPAGKVKRQPDAPQTTRREPGTPVERKAAQAPTPAPKAKASATGNKAVDETLEDLKAEFTKLSGKAPDKRWGVAKLTEKIKELQFKEL